MEIDEKALEAMVEKRVQEILDQKLEALIKARLPKDRLSLIASKGTMDMAYPPLILATSAVAMDMEAGIFFTFYGLDILHKKKNKNLKVPSVGNPAMPVPVPNIIGILPGMTAMATSMMKSWMAKQNVPTIPELLETAVESGVRLVGCQMTMDVMGVKKEDLIDGVEVGGAAMFLDYAAEGKMTIFV